MNTNIPYLLTEDQKWAVCFCHPKIVQTLPTISTREFSALLTGDMCIIFSQSDGAVTKYGPPNRWVTFCN